MKAHEVRNKYLQFLEDRGHVVIPRANLVPKEDPTTLFTGSGMQPLLEYLLGAEHPEGTRLVDSQTCLRAQDIDEVGDKSHTTFFEMLGNWSLGDYFKKEQIRWFFEFLTDEVGLDPNKIYATCFIGDEENNIPKDTESAEIWKELFKEKGIDAKVVEIGSAEDGDKVGMQGGRIFYYDDGENWWSRGGGISQTPMGDPCGPDSEVFYDFGEDKHDEEQWGQPHPANDSGRFMEIGNQVFMQYKRTESGFEPLPNMNVDFGGGLERIAAASIDSDDVFKISLIWPIIEKLEELSGKQYEERTEDMRVIADHLRAAMFLAVDGVRPSNKEQGYVMRRLMRRAILKAFHLGIEQHFIEEIAPVITSLYREDFPEVAEAESEVVAALVKEEKAFKQTVRKGLREFDKLFLNSHQKEPISHGEILFILYDTFGFPVEMSIEEAEKRGIPLDPEWQKDFDSKMTQQRERSQTAAKGVFKGGLAGHEDIHKKYHTATHLMYQALRDVLGDHVIQHGSNITEERLRFDFSHPEKVTPEQIAQVEEIVNEQIQNDLVVTFAEYPTEEATGPLGALGQFGDRYGDKVKVYNMQAAGADKPFSFEICGGPHVDRTSQLAEDGKKFKITKEQSSSAGIRRIKAILA
ncbi:MAG: alanine--tRNA ligase [Gammaproteobacteria bacterium]|nr:alanine--tRNA ligase [Gammaproteobacteria bacterium]